MLKRTTSLEIKLFVKLNLEKGGFGMQVLCLVFIVVELFKIIWHFHFIAGRIFDTSSLTFFHNK